jgi:DNA-directed RNA polymerase subunit RPC12/RpoP
MAEDDTLLLVEHPAEHVRCVECRHEYELPPIGEEIGCPECGCVSWVSTRIPASPLPEPRRVEAERAP